MARKNTTVGTSAVEFLPPRISLASMRRAVQGCRGCPLFLRATQAVFGLGPARARVIFVGEQPGNAEDLEGRPFVGPAGRLLDEGLDRAGIPRDAAYVTNVVKHFKWEPKGKARIHKKPSAREIAACLPWLEHEIQVLEPEVLVCLGATAVQSLLGRDFRVSTRSGAVVDTALAKHAVATMHPSSILRQRGDAERHAAMDRFVADLTVVAGLLRGRR